MNHTCEFCGSTDYNWNENCFACEKYICCDCIEKYCDRLDIDPWEGYRYESFDFPAEKPFICKDCNNKLKPYAEKAKKVRSEASKKIGKIQKEFEREIK